MSYMRSPYQLEHFDKISKMYVYPDEKGIDAMGYQDEDMIEMLIDNWFTKDNEFKNWWINKMCERLNIKKIEVKDGTNN